MPLYNKRDAATVAMAPACFTRNSPTSYISLIVLTSREPAVMLCRTRGNSFSPRSTLRSRNCFLAFSISASTVLFCTLNSSITLLPSLYALNATFCASLTWSRWEATEANTLTARVPSRFISVNNGAILSKPPAACMLDRNFKRASLAFVFSNFVNSLTSSLASAAKRAGS